MAKKRHSNPKAKSRTPSMDDLLIFLSKIEDDAGAFPEPAYLETIFHSASAEMVELWISTRIGEAPPSAAAQNADGYFSRSCAEYKDLKKRLKELLHHMIEQAEAVAQLGPSEHYQ